MRPAIAEVIVQGETNPIRFEKFCSEVCEKHEGITFLPTSASYDRGRDARSFAHTRGSHAAIILCTLNRDIDDKLEKDVRKLAQTTRPERVVYCCSQKLSERKADELTATIRGYLPPTCSIVVLGAEQLANLAERFPAIFEKHYGAEARTLESVITTDPTGIRAETKNLRTPRRCGKP